MRAFSKTTVAAAFFAVSMILQAGCNEPVPTPTSFHTYNHKSGVFQCDCPDDWTEEGGGKKAYWAKFTRGGATIRLQTSESGSLLGDIAGSGGMVVGPDAAPVDLSPVAQVHEVNKAAFADDWSNFDEKTPVTVPTKRLGEARKSEFTASGSLGGKVHGYRATVLALNHCITIACTCPEAEWTKLQPAFDQVIASLARGMRE
jgi:hypothetical protein